MRAWDDSIEDWDGDRRWVWDLANAVVLAGLLLVAIVAATT